MTDINDTEHIENLKKEMENPVHSVMAPTVPQASIDGMEKAKNEDLEEFFKGMKKEVDPTPQSFLDNTSYPEAASLVPFDLPAESQGNIGSCTSWAVTNTLENKYAQASKKKLNFADTYLWYRQGKRPNSLHSAQTATKYWTVLNEYWQPYAEEGWPGWLDAKICAPTNPRELSNLEQMYEEISKGNPVIFSFSADFNNFAPNGYVDPRKTTINGAHAVCAVAYNRATRTFTCKNSWGNHGDKGYLHFPEEYVLSRKYWINMIAFDQQLLMKGGVQPIPVPPKPITHNVTVDCWLVKDWQIDGKLHHQYDWRLTGPDVTSVVRCEEKLNYKLGTSAKTVRAVDLTTEANAYLNTYADNSNPWSPGVIRVTFADGFAADFPLTFPKKV